MTGSSAELNEKVPLATCIALRDVVLEGRGRNGEGNSGEGSRAQAWSGCPGLGEMAEDPADLLRDRDE